MCCYSLPKGPKQRSANLVFNRSLMIVKVHYLRTQFTTVVMDFTVACLPSKVDVELGLPAPSVLCKVEGPVCGDDSSLSASILICRQHSHGM